MLGNVEKSGTSAQQRGIFRAIRHGLLGRRGDKTMGLQDSGAMSYMVYHSDKDWATNDRAYDFPKFMSGSDGVTAKGKKYPDKTLEIEICDLDGNDTTFRSPLPEVGPRGVQAFIKWSGGTVELHLHKLPTQTNIVLPGAP
jgi:hypothetical protein